MENSNRVESGRADSPAEKVAAFAILACAAAFGIYRLRYGLSFKEEGLCLSSPMRFSMGDLPFRDEALVAFRWFEILMTPVTGLLPEKGSVMALRQVNLVFHFACLGSLFYSLRKYVRPLLGAILFVCAAYSNIFNYWTPTYHSAAFDFACVALALLIIGCGAGSRRRAAALGLISGVAFSFAWACELPAVAALTAPGLVCAAGLLRAVAAKRSRSEGVSCEENGEPAARGLSAPFICGAAAVATSVLLLVCAFAAIGEAGLFPDLRDAARLTVGLYSNLLINKFVSVMGDMARALPWFAFHCVCWGAFLYIGIARRRGRGGIAALFCALFVAVIYTGAPLRVLSEKNIFILFSMADYYEGLCLLVFAAVPFALLSRRAIWGKGERRSCAIVFAAGVALHFALAISAGSGTLVGVVVALPFLLIPLGIGAARLFPAGRANAVAALCGCVALSLVAANMYEGSGHEWVWRFSKQYENDRLKGIYHFSESVESTDAVVEYFKPRLRKGDLLLSFYDIPMLYYLTGTRSALETGLPSHEWPEGARAEFVSRMVERGRVPCYAAHLGPVAREPVYDFVRRNYIPVARFGRYYVWKLRPAPGRCE